MELRQLRYVDAVATHRHFTRAAAAIGIVQPALSQQIKRLEQELGAELFHRTRGDVRLTAAGEALLPHVRRALADIDAGREEVAAITGLQVGRVRLGAMQALGPLDLARVIADFHRRHPAIEFTLREESTARMHELLADGHMDLAIGALEVERPVTLSAIPLLHEPVLLAVAEDHPLAGRRRPVAIARLRNEPFVVFRPGTGLRTTTDRVARAAGFTPQIAFETSNLDRLVALIGEGLGVSLIPESTARERRHPIRVIRVSPPLTRTVGLLRRADRSLAPAARALRDGLRRVAEDLA